MFPNNGQINNKAHMIPNYPGMMQPNIIQASPIINDYGRPIPGNPNTQNIPPMPVLSQMNMMSPSIGNMSPMITPGLHQNNGLNIPQQNNNILK